MSRHPHSPIEIEFSFFGQSLFSAYKPPCNRQDAYDVTEHADTTCPVTGGDIGESDVSWENTTCAAVSKARFLRQDHVRETARSMLGSSLNLGSTPEARLHARR